MGDGHEFKGYCLGYSECDHYLNRVMIGLQAEFDGASLLLSARSLFDLLQKAREKAPKDMCWAYKTLDEVAHYLQRREEMHDAVRERNIYTVGTNFITLLRDGFLEIPHEYALAMKKVLPAWAEYWKPASMQIPEAIEKVA